MVRKDKRFVVSHLAYKLHAMRMVVINNYWK